ncbi:sugar transferase [Gemmatimonadota bacterium]
MKIIGYPWFRLDHHVAARATADILAVLMAFVLVSLVFGEWAGGWTEYLLYALLMAVTVVAAYSRFGLYRPRITVLNLLELRATLEGALLAGAMFLGVLFLIHAANGQRALLFLAVSTTGVALLLERRIMAEVRRRGDWINGDRKRTLVYGYNEAGHLLMKKIIQAPEAGRELVGFVDDFVAEGAEVSFRVDRSLPQQVSVPLLGRGGDLAEIVRKHGVSEVLISSPDFDPSVLSSLSDLPNVPDFGWGITAQFGSARPDELVVEDVGAVPVLHQMVPHPHWAYEAAKRGFDFIVSFGGILVSAPIWLAVGIAVKLDSPGPVFFRQERIGKGGRRFVMFKFRSLQIEADPYRSASLITRSQVTRAGRILRATALDELPQLLNVLMGHMSLVGPRPEMPFLVDDYSELERRRLSVRPGITGVWQMSADRHGMEIHDNMEYDLFYISNRSFLLDVVLLFETFVFALFSIFWISRRRGNLSGTAIQEEKLPTLSKTGEYVLVALDQRDPAGLRRAWVRVARALVNEPFQVKVLVSDQHIGLLRETFAKIADSGREDHWVQFVPYRSHGSVRVLTMKARLVVTDVDHFSGVAREAGVPVVELSHVLTPGSIQPSLFASGLRRRVDVREWPAT